MNLKFFYFTTDCHTSEGGGPLLFGADIIRSIAWWTPASAGVTGPGPVNFLTRFTLVLLLVTAVADARKVKIRMATLAPDGTPWSDALHGMKKRVAKESGGSIQINSYLGGQLGGELETLRSLRSGRIQAWAGTAGSLASLVNELQLLELPYLFENEAEADYLLDSVLFDDFAKILAAKGMILHSWSENGWRHIGSKSKPVLKPEDLRGMKIRSQQSPVHTAMWNSWGTSAIAISIPEVLTSLQTGVVNGFDNSTLFATAAGWHSNIKHFSLTYHMYQPGAIIFNKKFWDRLNPEQQKILKGNPIPFGQKSRGAVRALEPDLRAIMQAEGVTIHTLTPEQTAVFKAKAHTMHQGIADKLIGKKLYQKAVKALKAYRKRK